MLSTEPHPAVTHADRRASLIAFTTRLIEAAGDDGFALRALGGIAVALQCPSAEPPGPLAREFSDVDLVVARRSVKQLAKLLPAHGCTPHERFNAANGDTRLLFSFGDGDGDHMDVFVDRFRLCHELPLAERLGQHAVTISPADLLLTKLQVAKLSHKDVTDAAALLLDQPLTQDASGIDLDYVTELLATDWGWWRTSTETIDALRVHFASLPLTAVDRERLAGQLDALRAALDERPKTLRWKARARVGERRPWRVNPDDLAP